MLKEIVLPPVDMKNFSSQPIDTNLIIMSHDFNVNELVIPFYEANVFDTYEAFYSFQGNTSIIIQEVFNHNNEIRIPIVNDVRRHKGIFTIELNASSNSTQATLLKLNVMVKRSNIDSNSEFLFNHYYKLFEDYEKEIAELNNATQSTIKTQLKQSQDNLQKVTQTLIAINDKVMVVNDTADGFMVDVATKQSDVTSKYNAFDADITEANQTIDELLALQPQFQAVLDETTGKDVISAPEIILARGGEADLKTRLDKEKQEVSAQLAQTMILVDDIENLQTLVNNAPDYSTILFPKGVSFTMDTDIIMKGKLSLIGNGCEINGKGRFRFYGVNDVTISGFRFVDTIGDGTIHTPLLFNPSPDHGGLNDNIKIYDNVFDGCELWMKSYKAEYSNNNVHIFNNHFIGNQTSKTVAGNGCIMLANGKNSKVYDNYFNTVGGYRYIKLMSGIGVEKIVNEDGVPHHSIIDDGYCENIEIKNNIMLGTLRKALTSDYAKQPIDLFNGASNILIKDNTIKVNVDSAVPLEHVIDGKEYGPTPFENYTNKVKDITIENNHIEGNFYNAIFLGNLYGQVVVKDHLDNVYDDNDSHVTISNNKIITTTTNMTYPTELIKVTGHKTVNIEKNTLKMNKNMTGLIKAIWVLSCGYIYIDRNKILEQGRIYIDEPYPIQGIYGLEGGRRRTSMKYIGIDGNTIEWVGVRGIVFGKVNTFVHIDDENIDTTLIIKNNYFNNKDTGARSLPLSTGGRFKQLIVEGNSYRTDGTGVLTYPNYTNMSVGSVIDKDNAWSNVSSLPTSGTFNQGHIIYKLNPTDYIGWVCTQKGTFGSLNGNSTIGDISNNTNELIVDSTAGLSLGQYLTIEGFDGIHRVISINNNSIYLDSVSDVTLTDVKVLFSNPVFKTYGGITT